MNAADGTWQQAPVIQLDMLTRQDHLNAQQRMELEVARAGATGNERRAIRSEFRRSQHQRDREEDSDSRNRGYSSRR